MATGNLFVFPHLRGALKNMKKLNILLLLPVMALALMLTFVGCGSAGPNDKYLHANEVSIAVDASFQHLMEGEIEAFNNKYVEAEVTAKYTCEDSVIWMLMKDSVRLAVSTRMLTPEEKSYVKNTCKRPVDQRVLAYDAFALIVNKQNTDTVITVSEIRKIAMGEITRWEQLSHGSRKGELKMVFDQNGSSTVGFIRDSLCNGKTLAGPVFEAGSGAAVVDAVREDPNLIGVVSTDWLRPDGAGTLDTFRDLDVNVMLVSRGGSALEMSKICRPYQYYIATGEYPLIRTVYVICTSPLRNGVMKNLFFFLQGDAGQRIICNDSQLLPHSMVQVRAISAK